MSKDGAPDTGAAGANNGDEGTGAVTAGNAGTGTAEDQSGAKVLTLTQEQLDQIIERRLAKAKDPEQERKAAEFDRIQKEQQTETERAEQARKEAEERAEKAIAAANQRLLSAELRLQAAAQGVRPEAIDLVVATLLTTADEMEVDDKGQVKGVEPAVKAFVAKNPYLKADAKAPLPDRSGGEFKGSGATSIDDQIAEAESKGDYKTARRLKLRKYETGKE